MIQEVQEINKWLKSQFIDLEFHELTHTYKVKGKILPSVSSLIKNFYDEFDTKNEAIKYANKRGFEIEDVELSWKGEGDIASTKGTRVHNFGEDYAKWKYFKIGEKPKPTCKQCLAIIEFWNDLPSYLIPVAFEIQMYSEEYGYCGTADILFYNTLDDTFVLGDYKTNKQLFGNPQFDKPLLHINKEFQLVQNNFGKYTLQFSFYQILLEGIGLEISSRILIWLQESEDKLYTTYRTKDVTKNLKSWMSKVKHRYE